MIDNGGKVNVGAPAVKGAKVTAKVLDHLKGDKVIVFKKKRRKGYRVKNGHRQYLTKLEIVKIDEKAAAKKSPAKKSEPKPKAVAKKLQQKRKQQLKKLQLKKQNNLLNKTIIKWHIKKELVVQKTEENHKVKDLV